MATVYILKTANSDLSGGADFNKALTEGAESANTINVSVAANTTETSYGYTAAGDPGTTGATGNYSVEVYVTSESSNIYCSIAVARVNSSGTQQAISSTTAEQNLLTTGLFTFNLSSVNLGTWNSGDRLRVSYIFRNSHPAQTRAVTIRTGTTDCEVSAPWGGPAIDELTAQDLTSGTPTIDQATIGQKHALSSQDVASGTPTIDTATIGQVHALTAQDVTSGTPTIDQATAGVPSAYIIDIDHETGDKTQYTSLVDPDGDELNVTEAAALCGTYGLAVTIDDTDTLYGKYDLSTANTSGVVRLRFYLDPNGLSMSASAQFPALYAFSTTWGPPQFGIYLVYDSGYKINVGYWRDGGTGDTSDYAITDDKHYIEVLYTRAASAVSSDGSVQLWIDGVSKQTISNIDNYDTFANFDGIWMGVGSGTSLGTTSGTFYVDDLLVNDTGDEIGPYQADNVDDLTSQDLTSGTPTIDQATIGQVHNLAPQDIASGTPTLDQAAIGQVHKLAAQDITSGTPTIDQATCGQSHILTAQDLDAGTPTIDQATIRQLHNLAAQDVTSGTPTIDQATIGQIHQLTAQDITSGTPTIDESTIGQAFALVAQDVTAGTPEIDQAAIGQGHNLTSQDITSGTPTIDAATIGQVHNLTAQDLTSGTPIIDQATLAEVGAGIDTLTAQDLTSGVPTVDAASIGQIHNLTGQDLTSGTPTIDAASLTVVYHLAAQDITSGMPTIDAATIGQSHALIAADLTSGTPDIASATIGQIHVLTAQDLTSGAPTIDQAYAGLGGLIPPRTRITTIRAESRAGTAAEARVTVVTLENRSN